MGTCMSHHFEPLKNRKVTEKVKIPKLLRCQNTGLKTIGEGGDEVLNLSFRNISSSQNQIIEILKIFLNIDADLDNEDESLRAVVQYAVEKRNINAVEWLIANGADLSGVAKNGQNSLFWLCYEPPSEKNNGTQQEVFFDLLVDGGCDVNARDNTGRTPLHVASESSNIAVVRKLLAYGAEINCRENHEGKTPLHLAVSQGHLETIKCLLNKGANVNSKDSFGNRPVHVAAATKNAGIVLEMLLRHGALVNARNNEGNTALVRAYLHGNIDCMKELLKNGADVNDKCVVQSVAKCYASCEARILLEIWIKLRAANLPCEEQYLVLTKDEDYQSLYEECLREIESLKSTFIDSTTSLYAWLHVNQGRRCIHNHNQKLLNLVYSPALEEQFPKYSIVILSNYRGSVARRALLQPAIDVWLKLTEIYLPGVCLERIFSYLYDGDLIDFVGM